MGIGSTATTETAVGATDLPIAAVLGVESQHLRTPSSSAALRRGWIMKSGDQRIVRAEARFAIGRLANAKTIPHDPENLAVTVTHSAPTRRG